MEITDLGEVGGTRGSWVGDSGHGFRARFELSLLL